MNHTNSTIKALLVALLIASESVQAHEYWLHPVSANWRVGDILEADVRNGEEFLGTSLPFNPDSLARAGLISDSARRPLSGRLGDYPAFQMPIQEPGLHLLLLESSRREISHENLQAFEQFLDDHSLNEIVQRHQQRGLPDRNIIEHYYRYCKSFILATANADIDVPVKAVSPSTPALQKQDQRLELVVEDNPLESYTIRVRLLFEGMPLANRQIELFYSDKTDSVTKTINQSDTEGYAEFDIAAKGDYLLNSVWIEESAETSAHWTTFWASLFFTQAEMRND